MLLSWFGLESLHGRGFVRPFHKSVYLVFVKLVCCIYGELNKNKYIVDIFFKKT